MKIGIDARCLEEQETSGVGEYALELIQRILDTDDKNEYVIFSNSYEQNSANFNFLGKYANAKLKRFRWPNKLLNLSFWYLNWPKIDKMIGGVDIFFAPNINFLALSGNCGLVTTFHDLSFEYYPEFFAPKARAWHHYFVNPRRIAKKSTRLIAASASTCRDLQELYAVAPQKVEIVYHGVDENFHPRRSADPKLAKIKEKYRLPEKFILFLGNLEPRKNIGFTVAAYKKFCRSFPHLREYKLVFAGKTNPLFQNLAKLRIRAEKDIFFTGYISRSDRPYVFSLASLFVYPSHFEGFGLPLLEAMASGVPAITSNGSSLPEVVSQSAIMVNPGKPNELTDALGSILSDTKLFGELRAQGLERAKLFTWKKCAENTLTIFARAYENRN